MIKGDVIYLGEFGSHLYGTNVPTSDFDSMGIFKDSLRDIILGKSKNDIDESDKINQKNSAGDVDKKWKELRQFIRNCLQGQTYAMNMLFTPKHHWKEYSPIWEYIHENRHLLVSNNIKPFVSYCREQSLKYSAKGDKMKTLNEVIKRIESFGRKSTVTEFFENNLDLLELKHMSRYPKQVSKTGCIEDYYDIVRSSCPGNRMLDELLRNVKGQFNSYGERSKKAMEDGGFDRKAYYHALRICWELEEYLLTGELTFPSPKRDELMKVRLGEYENDYVEKWIDDEIERVKLIPNNLPDAKVDFWEDFLMEIYTK